MKISKRRTVKETVKLLRGGEVKKNLSKPFKGRLRSIFYDMGVSGRKALNSMQDLGVDRPSKTEIMVLS